jgi:hypothetical protein
LFFCRASAFLNLMENRSLRQINDGSSIVAHPENCAVARDSDFRSTRQCFDQAMTRFPYANGVACGGSQGARPRRIGNGELQFG